MEETNNKKPSYEELENGLKGAQDTIIALQEKIREIYAANMFKRLDYLIKVLEIGNFPEKFTLACRDEVMQALTIVSEPNISTAESSTVKEPIENTVENGEGQ